jgi:uncharacterized protein (TIGR02996 family)
MTDEDALLAAIVAHPDDDTPRLVYADWLDEHGQPDRAEFIRLQCELAQVSEADQSQKSLQRAAWLLWRHTKEWLPQPSESLPGARYRFRRGFPELMEVDARHLLSQRGENDFGSLTREVIARHAGRQLVSLGQLHYPERIRLRARLDRGNHAEPILVDLLRQAPAHCEQHLESGRWLVCCWAVWSGPDRVVLNRLGVLNRWCVVRRARDLAFQVGIRPFDSHREFTRWCPIQTVYQCPIWLVLEDGKLVRESFGAEPPEPCRVD